MTPADPLSGSSSSATRSTRALPRVLAARDLTSCHVFIDIYRRLTELHRSPEEERYVEFRLQALELLKSPAMRKRARADRQAFTDNRGNVIPSLERAIKNYELETYDTWKESYCPLQLKEAESILITSTQYPRPTAAPRPTEPECE